MLTPVRFAAVTALVAIAALAAAWARHGLPADSSERVWRIFVQSIGEHRTAQPRFSTFPHRPWRDARDHSARPPIEQRAAALDLERMRLDSPVSYARLGKMEEAAEAKAKDKEKVRRNDSAFMFHIWAGF